MNPHDNYTLRVLLKVTCPYFPFLRHSILYFLLQLVSVLAFSLFSYYQIDSSSWSMLPQPKLFLPWGYSSPTPFKLTKILSSLQGLHQVVSEPSRSTQNKKVFIVVGDVNCNALPTTLLNKKSCDFIISYNFWSNGKRLIHQLLIEQTNVTSLISKKRIIEGEIVASNISVVDAK